jgi:hypothetical protein
MRHLFAAFVAGTVVCAAVLRAAPQSDSEQRSYARIGILRPRDGDTIDFEAGYLRHLEWHRQAGDRWIWYGWTISIGERQRGFVYATFGHSAESLDTPVSPAGDEVDTIANITPHAHFASVGLFEFVPKLSRGSGVPEPAARVEFTTVELRPGSERTFEDALAAEQSTLRGETLWYRMVSGGRVPCYVRLRPRPTLSAILESRSEQPFSDKMNSLIAEQIVEVLTFRPTLSYGVGTGSSGR